VEKYVKMKEREYIFICFPLFIIQGSGLVDGV